MSSKSRNIRLKVSNFRKKEELKKNFNNEEESSNDSEIDSENEEKKLKNLQAVEGYVENIEDTPPKKIKICSDIDNDNTSISDVETEELDENRFSSDESLCETHTDTDSERDCSNLTVDSHDDFNNEPAIICDLRKWFYNFPIPYVKLDGLLRALKPHHPELPTTSTTLLKRPTEKKYKVEKFNTEDDTDSAEFVYIGITEQLQRTVNTTVHKSTSIDLQFNSDGLPLFHSSSVQFWPLLGKVYSQRIVYEPFVIAVYCGKEKPRSNKLYLEKFVNELNSLLSDGIHIDGKNFTVNVMCFICDRPARAFLKCIKGHTGYYACERCNVPGYRKNNRTIFPIDGENVQQRSDESFRLQENPQHHHDISTLISITPKIDMVKDFSLDFMHLECLGIMKNC